MLQSWKPERQLVLGSRLRTRNITKRAHSKKIATVAWHSIPGSQKWHFAVPKAMLLNKHKNISASKKNNYIKLRNWVDGKTWEIWHLPTGTNEALFLLKSTAQMIWPLSQEKVWPTLSITLTLNRAHWLANGRAHWYIAAPVMLHYLNLCNSGPHTSKFARPC